MPFVTHLLPQNVQRFFVKAPNFKNFSFLQFNARSIKKNFDSICSTLCTIDENFTAICVSETWLNTINENLFNIPGYKFESCARPKKLGGGVGIFINSVFEFNRISDFSFIDDNIECLFVEIIIQSGQNIIIGCIYRPPSGDINIFNTKLYHILENICNNSNKHIFLLGDYNINLLKYQSHEPTASFLNCTTSFVFYLLSLCLLELLKTQRHLLIIFSLILI